MYDLKIAYVVYPMSTQAYFNARTTTWLNHKGYTRLLKCTTKNIVYDVYPRSTQAHFNSRTPTWLNQNGYITLAEKHAYVVYPMSTQAYFNARTTTWLNHKGYTTLFTCDLKYCLRCISQEHSGTFQCQDSYLAEPERIYKIS